MPPWRQQGRTPRAAHPGRARRLVGARTHTGPAGQGESRVSCRRSSQALALKEIWATNTGSVAASGAATPSPSQLSWSAPSTLRVEPDPQVSLELSAADVWSKGRAGMQGPRRFTGGDWSGPTNSATNAVHCRVSMSCGASIRSNRPVGITPTRSATCDLPGGTGLPVRGNVVVHPCPVLIVIPTGARACRCLAFKVTPRPGSRRESTPVC